MQNSIINMLRILMIIKLGIENFLGISLAIFIFFLPMTIVTGVFVSIFWIGRESISQINCLFSRCVTLDGRKIIYDNALKTSNACEVFLESDIGKVALKMSESAWLERYEKYGINDSLFRAYDSYQTLRSSPLKFEREWERANYQEIKESCKRLSEVVFK